LTYILIRKYLIPVIFSRRAFLTIKTIIKVNSNQTKSTCELKHLLVMSISY